MTLVVFPPDPPTRECPEHRGVLVTDSIPCMKCSAEKFMDEIEEMFARAIRGRPTYDRCPRCLYRVKLRADGTVGAHRALGESCAGVGSKPRAPVRVGG